MLRGTTLLRYSALGSRQFFFRHTGLLARPAIRPSCPSLAVNDLFRRGNMCLLNDDFHGAVDYFSLCPKNSDAVMNNLGSSYMQLKRYDMAERVFHQALKLNPTNFEVNYNLGCLYYRLGNSAESGQYFKRSQEIDSTHVLARKNYISIMRILIQEDVKNQRYQAAQDKLDDLIEKYDDLLEYGLMEKGKIHLKQKNYLEAMECFEHLKEVNPQYDEAKILFQKAMDTLIKERGLIAAVDAHNHLQASSRFSSAKKPEM